MTTWRFVAATRDSTVLGDLVDATSKTVTWSLDAPATATFTLNGRSDHAALLEEYITDLIVYRDGDRLFRGRVGATADDIGANDHNTTFSVVDYRGLLDRRIIWPASTTVFDNVDMAEIGWALINNTQAVTGGALGITQGSGAVTGVLKDRTYEIGKSIGEAITQLGQVMPGFDWEIDDGRAFNVYYPQRGTLREFGVAFDEHTGGNVTRISRTVDPGEFTNAVRVSGDETLTPVTRIATGLATRPEGRWERQSGYTDIVRASTLADRADKELELGSIIDPTYTMTLSPEAGWSPSVFWLGDSCPSRIQTGRLSTASVLRLHQITVAVGDNGGETVECTFGPPRRTTRQRLRGLASRLDNLERR